MTSQITRNNHYVPQWYQRGFLPQGQAMLYVLDIAPESKTYPDGRKITESRPRQVSPSRAFCEQDLYTKRLGDVINDDIEKFLFGVIDKRGAVAVRALIDNDLARLHGYFGSLFDYLDTQKLRTPKGLDWIRARYRDMTRIDLMVEMQGLRDMHCKMWSESVREVVSAAKSSVKFLVSDHPVTIYHREIPPDATGCSYPQDPGIELIGSQTIFALDCDHCLIMTNLEYAQSPATANVMSRRTNARFRGQSLVRTDAFIRRRELSTDEVVSINHVLKSRARRYIAAGSADWLKPEAESVRDWREIGAVLLPRDELWRFGGEIYVGYKDGTTHYQDAFGRTSRAHEYLSKQPPEANPRDDAYCPCGNGLTFGQCCKKLSPSDRPSWTSYSVRERNLMLCNAVRGILGLDKGKGWKDIQRELSDEQVKRIHRVFESLWPLDTLLREILPPRRNGIVRALFMGHLDPRTVTVVATAWLDYFDEIILSHPFINAATVKPEFSPTQSPRNYKDQTLRNVLILLELEQYIRAGRVHLVPDPTDLEAQFRQEQFAIGRHRDKRVIFSDVDRRIMEALGKDDFKRWTLRGSDEQLAKIVRSAVPGVSSEGVQEVVTLLKQELEDDPLALLQPITPGDEGAQLLAIKSFTLETGLYVASLTGSIIYCLMDATWNLLHEPDGERQIIVADHWSAPTAALGQVSLSLCLSDKPPGPDAQARMEAVRELLRQLVRAAQSDASEDLARLSSMLAALGAEAQAEGSRPDPGFALACVRVSVPVGGFHRREVTRMILTYGLASAVPAIPMALQVRLNLLPQQE